MTEKSRVWVATKKGDIFACHIEDTTVEWVRKDAKLSTLCTTPQGVTGYVMAFSMDWPLDGCTKGFPCGPGQPCPACQEAAFRYGSKREEESKQGRLF
ncbi:MAG: hypothetical protein WC911_01615 [Thermoleophilia bacterium]